MLNIVMRLWKDERGFVVSAELVLLVTIGVLGMIVGISSIASAVNNEMNDVGNAFGAVNQSYWHSGLVKFGHSGVAGSGYLDNQDFCDCSTIVRTVPRVKAAFPRGPGVAPPPFSKKKGFGTKFTPGKKGPGFRGQPRLFQNQDR